jgi:hypothetical protein
MRETGQLPTRIADFVGAMKIRLAAFIALGGICMRLKICGFPGGALTGGMFSSTSVRTDCGNTYPTISGRKRFENPTGFGNIRLDTGRKTMQEIGVGIVGWGFMGRTHAHVLREIPLFYPGCGFKPVIRSVCSRRLEIARDAAELLGAPHFTDDYHELLARPDLQVLSICTPNALHEEMIVDALKAGKHLYIDKPLTVDGASAARIEAAARTSSSLTQMAHNNRFFPSVLRAKQLMDEGRLGNLLSFAVRYDHSGSIDASRPAGWKLQESAGGLLDIGSHALDMMSFPHRLPQRALARCAALPGAARAGRRYGQNLADDQRYAAGDAKRRAGHRDRLQDHHRRGGRAFI